MELLYTFTCAAILYFQKVHAARTWILIHIGGVIECMCWLAAVVTVHEECTLELLYGQMQSPEFESKVLLLLLFFSIIWLFSESYAASAPITPPAPAADAAPVAAPAADAGAAAADAPEASSPPKATEPAPVIDLLGRLP